MSAAIDHCIQEFYEQELFDDIAIDTIVESSDDFLLAYEENALESDIHYKLFQERLD